MNKILMASAMALIATTAFAGPPKDKKAPAAPKQDKCAVTGEKLGSMGKPIEVAYTGKLAAYKGKKVLVCCGGCTGKVQKDPDKYFKAVFAPAKPTTAAKPAGKMGTKKS
ncbi:MAG: hypothetical protein QM758_17030 [Armatimonas sp.]